MNSIKLESTLNALGLLTEKALDTCEDIYLHIRRLVPLVPSASGIRKKVLVLGSGWSAHAFLKVIVNYLAFLSFINHVVIGNR
jgi:hypothetical protein